MTTAWRVEQHAAIPSTQDLAIAAANAGTPDRLAIIAGRQTAGRGRDGRVWSAPAGNLNLSALLRPAPARPCPASWSLMAGLAVHQAIAGVLPDGAPLMLKWPNDLLLGGAKLAGVLIDSGLAPDGTLAWVVIGIGVNIAHAPAIPGRPTACLADHGAAIAPPDLAPALLAAIDHWSAQDLPAIRAAWLARAHPAGTRLRVHRGGRMIEGVFEGLGPDGSLLLHGHGSILSGEASLEASDAAGG